MATTRSKAKAASSVAVAQEDVVTINWIFFNKSIPKTCYPVPIELPRALFNRCSRDCREVFAADLLEVLNFKAAQHTIMFWKSKKSIPFTDIDTWEVAIPDSVKSEDYFQRIFLPTSFAKALKEEIHDDEIVHLAITADAVEEHHDEQRDVVSELRRNDHMQRPTPSQGAKSKEYAKLQSNPDAAIHDGKLPANPQFSTVAPPIQIYHSVFDIFIRAFNDPNIQPTLKELKEVSAFMDMLSGIGTDEIPRNEVIRDHLRTILGFQFMEVKNPDSTSPDASFILSVCGYLIPMFHMESKRELGDGGCDPSTQVGLSMKRAWIQRDQFRDKCCVPTLMLVVGGAWLGVLGGVITDVVIVQRLTDLMWNGRSSTEEDARMYRLARIMLALRVSLAELATYYNDIGEQIQKSSSASGPSPSRFFPYPTSYTDENGAQVKFKYECLLETDELCVTYLAQITNGDHPVKIVVKFVARYGKEVHEFLAREGYAPKLRYYGPLSAKQPSPLSVISPPPELGLSTGPMQMVVMDFVTACEKVPSDAREQLKVVLEKLHSAGYVFGDLRLQNILFDEQSRIKLIDFDWAGRYAMDARILDESPSMPKEVRDKIRKKVQESQDKIRKEKEEGRYTEVVGVRYPADLSKVPNWAAGVEDRALILPEHDWWFYLSLFTTGSD